MIVLVLNCGSSSIKFKLYNMESETEYASGVVEKIGADDAIFKYKNHKEPDFKDILPVASHGMGLQYILSRLKDPVHGVIKSESEITAVGHRVVHGGEKFKSSIIITSEVIEEIEKCIPLAPLHNPPNLTGIKECMKLMNNAQQIAVFDTAFHQSIPDYAYIYPLPYAYYREDRVRRYGFHGTSHRYIAQECAKRLQKPLDQCKIITCHLGNGSSIAAINRGKSIDTTMGYTPLEGIMMGTRSGTVDPAIVLFLLRHKKMSVDQVDDILNKHSGFLGVSELSNDLRDVTIAAKENHALSKLSLEICSYQLKKYVGSYIAAMNGVDAIVFSGGVGENTEEIRELSMSQMEGLGIHLDAHRNLTDMKKTRMISTDDSPVKIFVIFTDEEIMIARDTKFLLENQ
jgi:acetate kinase